MLKACGKYLILGLPIFLSLLASIPAIIAIKTNDKEYQSSARVAEAKIQLKEIVELILQKEELNLNLVELGYKPEGKLANIYGVNPLCFPKFKNTNLIEVSQLPQPVPLFKWMSEIQENLKVLEQTLLSLPCPEDGKILIYALYVDDSQTIQGWTMDLEKQLLPYLPPKGSR